MMEWVAAEVAEAAVRRGVELLSGKFSNASNLLE